MKLRSVLFTFLSILPVALFAADTAKNCGCACCKGKEVCCCHAGDEKPAPAADAAPAPQMHPLKGVVVDVLADKSALLVKHEDIPGVMRAMTMMFRVDAETLARVKKGDAITAQMGRDTEKKWILRDVQVVTKS